MHAEVFGDAAQLIECGSSDCHDLGLPLIMPVFRGPYVAIPTNSPIRLASPSSPIASNAARKLPMGSAQDDVVPHIIVRSSKPIMTTYGYARVSTDGQTL